MARRKKHPGVVLIKPDRERRIGWRARFTDPDTGKARKVSLDTALTTVELREQWALRKSKQLAQRRLDLDAGATPASGLPLDAAVRRYYAAHPQLRPTTLRVYHDATDKLLAWAERFKVRTVDDLTRARLMQFREQLVNEPKHSASRKGQRGQQRRLKQRRSPHTVNRELRAVRTVLGYLLDADFFANLTHEDLRRALKRLSAPLDRQDYLKPKQLQKLLQAAQRHDAKVFTETRDEHAGRRLAGGTARYDSIGPFVAFCLLTGMRFGEAIELDWKQVDVDALDGSGNKVGEVYVTSASKTSKARTVGLEVSPTLRRILAAQKLRTGGKGKVFGLTRGTAEAARKRLYECGAPDSFNWQILRVTCSTYLCNAGGIFRGASAYRSAKQLGHSVQVAEKHYAGLMRGISPDARTLEAAMQIEKQLTDLLTSTRGQKRGAAWAK